MQKELEELGLNNNEAAVYLKLLSVQRATAPVLAYKTGISRCKVRYTCEQLKKKGLVNCEEKGNTLEYWGEAPERIRFLLEREKEKISQKEDQLDRIIGDLKTIANPDTVLPKVRFYEGYKGVKNSYRDMINECEADEMSAIFSVVESTGKELQDFFIDEYVPSRCKKGIRMKNLCLESPRALKYKGNDLRDLRETKTISRKYFPAINTEMNIYDDTMHYMSFDKNSAFAMIVKDKYIVKMLKAIFKILWEKT